MKSVHRLDVLLLLFFAQNTIPPSNQVTGATDGFNRHRVTRVTAGNCTRSFPSEWRSGKGELWAEFAAVHFHLRVTHEAPLLPHTSLNPEAF